MKRALLMGTMMMSLVQAGCAVETEVPEDLDLNEVGQVEPDDIAPPSTPPCKPRHTTFTTTSNYHQTTQRCGGWSLTGSRLYCDKYVDCIKTTTWGRNKICEDDGTWTEIVYYLSEQNECESYEQNDCGVIFNVTCWEP